MVRGWAQATAMLALSAGAAAAQEARAFFPAAQCAAFWMGRSDVAAGSRHLDAHPSDRDRARAFRDAAVRLGGGDAGKIDAFIAEERPRMALTVRAHVLGGDAASRDIHDRLLKRCEDFAATQPETRDLP
ncbi:hypothetical protein [Ruixingdingia sedimenti]|uniref:Uncharacterized protein n=1 Tax=Ruixingdingia sedimenti TaxID=3073604 RepID=A0ABU1FAZ2_9RHOB|nr:hypothetical protein [Xinfangfangia sp. LG-4]MDR5654025.1 hypothetical protein [Xinfangfangia sp. LG-4]